MKSVVLISHPDIDVSSTQQFLLTVGNNDKQNSSTDFFSLDKIYHGLNSEKKISDLAESLLSYQRIIFQFPLYWYSCPASLKQFIDDNFTRHDVIANNKLARKELGIVVSTGEAKDDFQAGGSEKFSMSEILIPFRALAKKAGMKFLKPLIISQFAYLTTQQKKELAVNYLEYLESTMPLNLENKTDWLLSKLVIMSKRLSKDSKKQFDLAIESLKQNQTQLEDLKANIKMIRDQEE